MKLRKEEFFDCYEFVSAIQMKVIKELDGRAARLSSEDLTVYDFATKMITQSRLRTWENYESVKRYTFAVPIGVAVSLFKLMSNDEAYTKKSITSILFHRLINVLDPDVLIYSWEASMPFIKEFPVDSLPPREIIFFKDGQ
jgi:hypothetical protein